MSDLIKRQMQDLGVSWLQDCHTKRIYVKATGEDRSGAVILCEVPDDVVMDRAVQIIKEIRGDK